MNAKIPGSTFSAQTLVWIELDIREDWPAGDPRGLKARLCAWLDSERIDDIVTHRSGPWHLIVGFAPADAERVFAWLREHGVEETPP